MDVSYCLLEEDENEYNLISFCHKVFSIISSNLPAFVTCPGPELSICCRSCLITQNSPAPAAAAVLGKSLDVQSRV